MFLWVKSKTVQSETFLSRKVKADQNEAFLRVKVEPELLVCDLYFRRLSCHFCFSLSDGFCSLVNLAADDLQWPLRDGDGDGSISICSVFVLRHA